MAGCGVRRESDRFGGGQHRLSLAYNQGSSEKTRKQKTTGLRKKQDMDKSAEVDSTETAEIIDINPDKAPSEYVNFSESLLRRISSLERSIKASDHNLSSTHKKLDQINKTFDSILDNVTTKSDLTYLRSNIWTGLLSACLLGSLISMLTFVLLR